MGRNDDGEDGDDGGAEIPPGSRRNQDFGLVVAEVYCSFLSVAESGGSDAKNDQHTERSDTNEERMPTSCVRVRTEERLHFFRLFTELIRATAEELMCGMGTGGWHYDDVVNRMTTSLWEIARCGLIPSAVDDAKNREEIRWKENP